MATVNLAFIFQIIHIVMAALGVAIALYWMIVAPSVVSIVSSIAHLFLIALLLLSELYIFSFFKYFGFILKLWGKGALCIYYGCCFAGTGTFGWIATVVFWVIGIIDIILGIVVKTGVSKPLLQKGDVDLSTNSSDYYGNESGA